MKPKKKKVLNLYSSDFRTLYLQDCLDLLSLPEGAIQRFRYARRHVWLGPNQTTGWMVAMWNELVGAEVLVHFVASESVRYRAPTFVPLRRGRVVRTFVEGDIFVVDFEVGAYLDPRQYLQVDGTALPPETFNSTEAESAEFQLRRDAATAFTGRMAEAFGDYRPSADWQESKSVQRYSAVYANPTKFFSDVPPAEQTAAFSALAAIMHDLVGLQRRGTKHWGSVSSFFRVVGLYGKHRTLKMRNGRYTLRSGSPYQLRVMHINFGDTGPDELSFAAPSSIAVTGPEPISLAGRYDVREFNFNTAVRESSVTGVVEVSSRKINGDSVDRLANPLNVVARLPLRSLPRRIFTALSVAVVIGTTVAAFALAANALDAIIILPPAEPTLYLDLSPALEWLSPTSYLAIAWSAVIPATATAIVAGLVAVAAVFRRRWGLSETPA